MCKVVQSQRNSDERREWIRFSISIWIKAMQRLLIHLETIIQLWTIEFNILQIESWNDVDTTTQAEKEFVHLSTVENHFRHNSRLWLLWSRLEIISRTTTQCESSCQMNHQKLCDESDFHKQTILYIGIIFVKMLHETTKIFHSHHWINDITMQWLWIEQRWNDILTAFWNEHEQSLEIEVQRHTLWIDYRCFEDMFQTILQTQIDFQMWFNDMLMKQYVKTRCEKLQISQAISQKFTIRHKKKDIVWCLSFYTSGHFVKLQLHAFV